MHEKIIQITNNNIPKEYKVQYHELRGYDSPDKWYTCWYKTKLVGECSRLSEAIEKCLDHGKKNTNS